MTNVQQNELTVLNNAIASLDATIEANADRLWQIRRDIAILEDEMGLNIPKPTFRTTSKKQYQNYPAYTSETEARERNLSLLSC